MDLKSPGGNVTFVDVSVNDDLASFIFELIKALRKCWYGEVFFQMVKTHYLSSYQTIEKNSSNHSYFFFPCLRDVFRSNLIVSKVLVLGVHIICLRWRGCIECGVPVKLGSASTRQSH